MRTLEIKKKKYPINLGFAFLRRIQKNPDYIKVTEQAKEIKSNNGDMELELDMPLDLILEMLHISLTQGAIQHNKKFNWTVDELSYRLDEDSNAITLFMQQYTEVMTDSNKSNEAKKEPPQDKA